MEEFPKDGLNIGDEYRGWTYMGGLRMPVGLSVPVSHALFFRKVDPSIDDADEMLISNGQGPGPRFCLHNGRIGLCPVELQIFTGATFSESCAA